MCGARRGELSLTWKNGVAVGATLHAAHDQRFVVRCTGHWCRWGLRSGLVRGRVAAVADGTTGLFSAGPRQSDAEQMAGVRYVGRARMDPQLKPAPKTARTMGVLGGVGLAMRHSDAAMRREAEDVLP